MNESEEEKRKCDVLRKKVRRIVAEIYHCPIEEITFGEYPRKKTSDVMIEVGPRGMRGKPLREFGETRIDTLGKLLKLVNSRGLRP